MNEDRDPAGRGGGEVMRFAFVVILAAWMLVPCGAMGGETREQWSTDPAGDGTQADSKKPGFQVVGGEGE